MSYPFTFASPLLRVRSMFRIFTCRQEEEDLLVQYKYAQSTDSVQITGVIPFDDTIPQTSEMTKLPALSVTFTPKAGNIIVFQGVVQFSAAASAAGMAVALVKNGDSGASYVFWGRNYAASGRTLMTIHAVLPSPVIAAQTWDVYAAVSVSNGYVNAQSDGSEYWSTAGPVSNLAVLEIKQ
jgi:hypothetical protein